VTTVLPDHPINGVDYAVILSKLALVNALAGSLKLDLEPLSTEDAEAGAEPLEAPQIQVELDRICQVVTEIALLHLKASPDEWVEANDSIA
jgi:hypothetical protein